MSLRTGNNSNHDVEGILPLMQGGKCDNALTTKSEQSPEWKRNLILLIDTIEGRVQVTLKCFYKTVSLMKRVIFRQSTPKHLFLISLCCFLLLHLLDFVHSHYYQSSLYGLALAQSYGLIGTVKNSDWVKMQDRLKNSRPHKFGNVNTYIDDPNVWYKYNWNPDFMCPFPERVGSDAFGGKWVCNPKNIVSIAQTRAHFSVWERIQSFVRDKDERVLGKNGCLIYSIGINSQRLDFEDGIQELLSEEAGKENFCEIHVFDPDSFHERLILNDKIQYHNWGIRSKRNRDLYDDEDGGKFMSFEDTLRELGHEGLVIDIMKVDCKMCEWEIFQDWFDFSNDGTDINGPLRINQLLVEVHGTPQDHVNDFFDRMRAENFVIFHKQADTEIFAGTSQDYSFLKLKPDFFI